MRGRGRKRRRRLIPPGLDIRRSSKARARRNINALERASPRTRKSATSSPPSRRLSRSTSRYARAHLLQRRKKPGPERVHHHPLDDDVRPPERSGQRRWGTPPTGDRRGATTGAGRNSGRPTSVICRPLALKARHQPPRAEMGEHLLGMVARGLIFDYGELGPAH